jgi:hypothetical protein
VLYFKIAVNTEEEVYRARLLIAYDKRGNTIANKGVCLGMSMNISVLHSIQLYLESIRQRY